MRQNNQAALDYMMRGKQLEEAQAPQPEAWALSILASKLIVGPPLLTAIIDCLENIDDVEAFVNLIGRFIPEHMAEIMAEPRSRRVYRFCYLFGKKYYPLPANTDCGIGEWVSSMPVELLGMSYTGYHELEMRPGYLLLLSLVIYPYEGDERDMDDTGEERTPFGDRIVSEPKGKTLMQVFNGARVPLLDAVQRLVGGEVAGHIPQDGWQPDELHQMTDKTPYDGVGDFADWSCSETGYVMLDSSFDDCEYVEGYGEPLFKWTRRNVDILTEQWPRVQEIRGKIDHIVEWVEADQNHFRDLLEFLLKSKHRTDKARRRWYDPTEHMCQLDQRSRNEEDEDEENDN